MCFQIQLREALNIVQPRTSQVEVTKLDKNRNVMMLRDAQSCLTTLYRSRSPLFSTAGQAEPERGMQRSRFERKDRMYVQRTLMNWEEGTYPPRIGVDAGENELKEEDFVDEIMPAVTSTLGEEKWTEMSKLVKMMDLLCSIYDMDFKRFGKGARNWCRKGSE